MTSQPENSAPTPSTETSSAPASSQQSTANDGFRGQQDIYDALQEQYARDATGDERPAA
jgi:hypothetical protein